MTIADDSRKIVDWAMETAVRIVDERLHALKSKNEKEFDATTSRIIQVAQMLVTTRLHLERMMMVDPPEDKEANPDDPDLFTGAGTRIA